jgi:hypothetical protein
MRQSGIALQMAIGLRLMGDGSEIFSLDTP